MNTPAQQLKLDGMLLAASKHKESLKAAQFIAQLLGAKQDTVSINDVRRYVQGLDNASGSVFRGGDWQPVGWVETEHDEGHARPVRCWRMKRGNG